MVRGYREVARVHQRRIQVGHKPGISAPTTRLRPPALPADERRQSAATHIPPSLPRSRCPLSGSAPLPPFGRVGVAVRSPGDARNRTRTRHSARASPSQRPRSRQVQRDPARIYPLGVDRSITGSKRCKVCIRLGLNDVVVVDHHPSWLLGVIGLRPLSAIPHELDAKPSCQRPNGYISATRRRLYQTNVTTVFEPL